MEPLATLRHHRKSDNRYAFTFGRQTITVARRFLPSRSVRVRVTSTTISGQGEGNWSQYRDFTDMHEGDAAYSKQARTFCSQWEERYVNTPKKETPVDNETPDTPEQPEPTRTQMSAGYTATPAKAAQLATRHTGVRHIVGQDGRTLCRAPAAQDGDPQQGDQVGPADPDTIEHRVPKDAPVHLTTRGRRALAEHLEGAPQGPVLEGVVVGRILGETTYRVRTARPSRSGEMGKLLGDATVRVTAFQMFAHACRTTGRTGHAPTDQARDAKLLQLEAEAAYFGRLLDAGYAPDTTWDELLVILKPLVDDARYWAWREAPDADGQATVRRAIVGAQLFLTATEGVRKFYEDQDADGE